MNLPITLKDKAKNIDILQRQTRQTLLCPRALNLRVYANYNYLKKKKQSFNKETPTIITIVTVEQMMIYVKRSKILCFKLLNLNFLQLRCNCYMELVFIARKSSS